jgi:hypothetical protein
MSLEDNPFLQPPPNPFDAKLAARQTLQSMQIQLERLCFEIFIMGNDGKMLADLLRERYILPSHFAPTDPNADKLALWWDGFRTAIRGLTIENGLKHQQRINQGGQR